MVRFGESVIVKGYMKYVVQQDDVNNKNSWFATLAGYAIPVTSCFDTFGTKENAIKNAAMMLCLYPKEYKELARKRHLKITQSGVKRWMTNAIQ